MGIFRKVDETVMEWFEPKLWRLEYETGMQRKQIARYLLYCWAAALNVPLLAKGASDGLAFYLVSLALASVPIGFTAVMARRFVDRHNFGGAGKPNVLRYSWQFRTKTLLTFFLLSPFLVGSGGLRSVEVIAAFLGATSLFLALFLVALCANLMPPGFRKVLEARQVGRVGKSIPT